MDIHTKFDIGDAVLIRGERYTVDRITVEARKEAPALVIYHGSKALRVSENETVTVGDAAAEEEVAADPLENNYRCSS